MIIALLGASGSGKSTIESLLAHKYGFEKIVSYTTRATRDGEVNGKDYYFVTNEVFNEMLSKNLFAEYDEYSQNRQYGTLITDYIGGNKVVVLTPNGLRQLKNNPCLSEEKIFTVFVDASLGTRIKRYIDRCGVENFDFDDKNEISARVERDYGMFLGLEKEADMYIYNSEGADIDGLVDEVIINVSGF